MVFVVVKESPDMVVGALGVRHMCFARTGGWRESQSSCWGSSEQDPFDWP